MQTPRGDVLVHVADNVRRLREEAGMSQNRLAEVSGVSRRTIISVEAGAANISLAGLDKLAGAMGVTFVDLVTPPSASRAALDVVAWRGSGPVSRAVLWGTVRARAEAQLWSWTLAEGGRYDAEPDPQGWSEMLVVTTGRLLVEREDGASDLVTGQYAIFSSAQHYRYVNLHRGTTQFVRTVVS